MPTRKPAPAKSAAKPTAGKAAGTATARYERTWRPSRLNQAPEKLGDVISGWLEATGLLRRTGEDQLLSAWAEVLGPALSAMTRLSGFRRGVLTVTVASAPLRQELIGFRGPEILAALNQRLIGTGVHVAKLTVKLSRGS